MEKKESRSNEGVCTSEVRELLRIDPVWDMVIAHPPCTRLCNSGVLRLYKNGKKVNGIDLNKWDQMLEAVEFFKFFTALDIPKVCIENPIQHGHGKRLIEQPYKQVIQPYEFGEDASKKTCLG